MLHEHVSIDNKEMCHNTKLFFKFWFGFDSWRKCTNPTVFVYNPYLHSLTYLDFLLVPNWLFVSSKSSFYYHYLSKIESERAYFCAG